MAREKHVVDLTIGNFKRFADFEVKNLGQFNLIVGDNNTGKTSMLEALLFDEEMDVNNNIHNLYFSLYWRSKPEMVLDYQNYVFQYFGMFLNKGKTADEIKISLKNIVGKSLFSLRKFDTTNDLKFLNELEKERLFSLKALAEVFIFTKNSQTSTTLQSLSLLNNYSPFIVFGLGYDEHLVEYYSEFIDINKGVREEFIENLKIFIPKVNDVRVGNETINIYEENVDTPMPLFAYGEGANKLFRILCEIAMNQGKRLMIDEIDAGIHYSRFKNFWRTIMKVAKSYDVQIFATTHNLECIDYFREVLEEEEMKEYQELGRVVALKEMEDNSVKARVYDYEYLEYADEANRELRG